MNLNHMKLGAYSTPICRNDIVKHILRFIRNYQTTLNSTDRRMKSSAVVKLKFVTVKRNFVTNSSWSLTNTSVPSKLIGANLKQGHTKMYCTHQNSTSHKVYGLLEFIPKGYVHRHVFKRESSTTAGNVDDDQNQSIADKDRQEEVEENSMETVNPNDSTVSGLSDEIQENCKLSLKKEATKTSADKMVTKPFKIYNLITSNLDSLFPNTANRYHIYNTDKHATKVNNVPHLQVEKIGLMPINNELKSNIAVRRPNVISISKSRGRRCIFKQAKNLPSSDERNMRLDDLHFSKYLEPKSEVATRLFGQERAQQNTQLNMPLVTPREVIPIKEKLLSIHRELPTKIKLSVEEDTMQQQNKNRRITITNPDKQHMRLDDIHFNKNLEPKSEIAKRLFEQETDLQNAQLNMPLPKPSDVISTKVNLLEVGKGPSTEMNLSMEEAIKQQCNRLENARRMESSESVFRVKQLESQFLADNEKLYQNNIPANKQSLEKHELSIQYDRDENKCNLTHILQTLMSSTTNKSNKQNKFDLKPELQLEKRIDTKSPNSELMIKLSNSRASHLQYTQDRKME